MNIQWEALSRAFVHPLRISILEVMTLDGGRTLSPNELSQELQEPKSKTAFHVNELAKAGLLVLVREQPVRGATEHFYELAPNPEKEH
jgi:predicted transcriptional regulator